MHPIGLRNAANTNEARFLQRFEIWPLLSYISLLRIGNFPIRDGNDQILKSIKSEKNCIWFFPKYLKRMKKINLAYSPSNALTNPTIVTTYVCLIAQTIFQCQLNFTSQEVCDYNELKLEYEAYRCPVPAVSIHSTTI